MPPERFPFPTAEAAILHLRAQPGAAGWLRDAYLDENPILAARRFSTSGEFAEVRRLLGDRIRGHVLDLGAGTGPASHAFAANGAGRVWALEPDASPVVGRGAAAQATLGLPVQQLAATGESVPLPDACIDVVYVRQVLHHVADLDAVLRESARVLRPGGAFLACREHVVDDRRQLDAFRRKHLMYRLTGSESAFSLPAYLGAIKRAGLEVHAVYGPFDSVLNTHPGASSREELARYPALLLERRFDRPGRILAHVPGVRAVVWSWLRRPVPGRLYSFWATRP